MENRIKLSISQMPKKYKRISSKHIGEHKNEVMNINLKNIKEYLKSSLNLSNFKGIILTVISSIIAYFFYILGYIFLYSYSFPGDVEEQSVFEMYLNQVPFNFKVNVAIGIILLIIMLSMSIPLINIYFKKELFTNWVVFIGLSIMYGSGINYIISSAADSDFINRILYITSFVSFIPVFTLCLVYDMKMWIEKPKRFLAIFFGILFILILCYVFLNFNLSWACIIFFILIAVINYIINLINRKHEKEVSEDKFDSNKNIKIKTNMISNSICLACACLLGSSAMLLYYVRDIGNFAANSKEIKSQTIIKYNVGSDKFKEVTGHIVAFDDDKYYISLSESERLMIIKSDTIIEMNEDDN